MIFQFFRLSARVGVIWAALFWAIVFNLAHAAPFSDNARANPVTASLVSDHKIAARGAEVTVAVKLSMAKGWHTYWKNPGDTGLPTTVIWELSDSLREVEPIAFPAPERQTFGAFVNYGYTGDVYFLARFLVAEDAPDLLTIAARVDWLQCADICVPQGEDVSILMPISDEALLSDDAKILEGVREALPRPLKAWAIKSEARDQTLLLTLTPTVAGNARSEKNVEIPTALYFFSDEERVIEPSAPQIITREKDDLTLTLPVSYQYKTSKEPLRLAGVLRAEYQKGKKIVSSTIDTKVTGIPRAGDTPTFNRASATQTTTHTIFSRSFFEALVGGELLAKSASLDFRVWVLTLLSALMGGLLLNLMPCVFPIVSIKALALAQSSEKSSARREAFYFAIGVTVTFLILGVTLSALRAAGEELGWGFQLQSPLFVLFLIALFFVIALNLSSVFEFGMFRAPFVKKGHSPFFNQKSSGRFSAFFSGVVTVAVASPCTAPFMGAALGVALAQPIYIGFMIFVALGLGMALPFVALAVLPAWRRFLPKPGVWLTRLKQLLAFPLYLTVAWLIWVYLSIQGMSSAFYLLALLPVIACAAFAWQCYRENALLNRKARAWGLLFLACVVAAFVLMNNAQVSTKKNNAIDSIVTWQPYDDARLSAFTAEGKTVFVDFTAAWCLTCRVNEVMVLETDTVRRAFLDKNIILMRADWTKRDATIAAALAQLGRNGVPVYAIYRPHQSPQLLPELLRVDTVLRALDE